MAFMRRNRSGHSAKRLMAFLAATAITEEKKDGDTRNAQSHSIGPAACSTKAGQRLDQTGRPGDSQGRIFRVQTRKLWSPPSKDARLLRVFSGCEGFAGQRTGYAGLRKEN